MNYGAQPQIVAADFLRSALLLLALAGGCRESPPTSPASLECERKVAAQKQALAADTLAQSETFARHPATERLRGAPVPVDVDSNRYARLFRTRLREEVEKHGVNFAGAYSLVSVGMTGWGGNYYIVDRRNGHVTLFPYYAAFLDFREDSSLIVMNPKHEIERAMQESSEPCYFLNQQEFTSLRTFYFLWRDGELVLIGPKGIEPPRNRFWDEYLPPQRQAPSSLRTSTSWPT